MNVLTKKCQFRCNTGSQEPEGVDCMLIWSRQVFFFLMLGLQYDSLAISRLPVYTGVFLAAWLSTNTYSNCSVRYELNLVNELLLFLSLVYCVAVSCRPHLLAVFMSYFVSYLFCLFSLSFTQTDDFCAVTHVFIQGTMASVICAVKTVKKEKRKLHSQLKNIIFIIKIYV